MSGSNLPLYTTPMQRAGHWLLVLFCAAVFVFLIAPVLVVVPLAFNNEPYFHFPVQVYSLRWFRDLFTNEVWLHAIFNSVVTATLATLLATALGTLAAVGLNHHNLPGKRLLMAVLVSPMIVPVVVLAVGSYLFFSKLGIANNLLGIVLVHAVLGMPFVVITVTATLGGFDMNLMRAARGLGASQVEAFRRIMLPFSTQWRTGTCVPLCKWVMQPMFALRMAWGCKSCKLPSFRSRSWVAIVGCKTLYVPADPQHKCASLLATCT